MATNFYEREVRINFGEGANSYHGFHVCTTGDDYAYDYFDTAQARDDFRDEILAVCGITRSDDKHEADWLAVAAGLYLYGDEPCRDFGFELLTKHLKHFGHDLDHDTEVLERIKLLS